MKHAIQLSCHASRGITKKVRRNEKGLFIFLLCFPFPLQQSLRRQLNEVARSRGGLDQDTKPLVAKPFSRKTFKKKARDNDKKKESTDKSAQTNLPPTTTPPLLLQREALHKGVCYY